MDRRRRSQVEDEAEAQSPKKTVAFCKTLPENLSRNTENGQLKLADGTYIPIASGVRDASEVKDTERLVSSIGYIGDMEVIVLRDT